MIIYLNFDYVQFKLFYIVLLYSNIILIIFVTYIIMPTTKAYLLKDFKHLINIDVTIFH